MSEALDKVRGVRELPVFPLPLVLFPGVPLPLHIFEERYRRMLADVRASNNLFGLSYFDPNATAGERPPAGHVGCATEVVESQALPDGRSLIIGGTSDYSFTGENRASIFDPVTGSFVQSQNMVDGRWYATATGVSPRNGTSPVSISYRTMPSEYRSDCTVTGWPSACSGET